MAASSLLILYFSKSKRLSSRLTRLTVHLTRLSRKSSRPWKSGQKKDLDGWLTGLKLSGWTFPATNHFEVAPLSCCLLPSKIKKTVINVKNNDDNCLRWASDQRCFQQLKTHKDPPNTQQMMASTLEGLMLQHPFPRSSRWKKTTIFGWDKSVIIHRLSKQQDIPILLLI